MNSYPSHSHAGSSSELMGGNPLPNIPANQHQQRYAGGPSSQTHVQQHLRQEPGKPLPPLSFIHHSDLGGEYASGPAAKIYSGLLTSLGSCFGAIGTFLACFGCNPYRTINQGNAGLVTRFGKYTQTVDPGIHYINIMTESLRAVDVRVQLADIPRQVAITKDNVTVSIDSVVYWHIVNPFTAVFQVVDVHAALIERTMATLRTIFGSYDLQDTIINRDQIAADIESIITPAAMMWGIKVERVLVKDIQYSQDLQEQLSSVAKQRRIAAAKIIQSEAEVESAKLLREAADILDSPAAMQIRYLDTLRLMAKEGATKVIFMPPNPPQDEISQARQAGKSTVGNLAVLESITQL